MAKKFTIRGKTYDLDDAADLVSIQNAMVPDNWPGKKADCVRLFIALQGMLSLQLARHFAANFKQISKAAQEEQAEGGSARIGVAFNFEIDQTSPLVAAITKLSMGFSVKHKTEGKPQTFDLTQGELPLGDDDMTDVFNTKSLEEEAKEKDEPKPEEGAENPPEPVPFDPDATPTPAGEEKPKRSRKKKND